MPRWTPALSPAEAHSAALEQTWEAFEALYPHVRGNPYFGGHWPHPPQLLFLGLHLRYEFDGVFEALFGGAAGGGKSDALLMAAAQYAWKFPSFSAAIFRMTFKDLNRPGAIMHRGRRWWTPAGVHWNANDHKATFPRFDGKAGPGAEIEFGHMHGTDPETDWQGSELQLTAWDELTHHPTPTKYEFVALTRCRGKDIPEQRSIPLRALSASNPGGPGHAWVKRRFVGGIDPATGARITPQHPFLPSRIEDNPSLNSRPYIASLLKVNPTLAAQLLAGDWDARPPGQYFRREWFGPLLDPDEDRWPARDCVRVRWWDLAASEAKDAAYTSGVLMARHRSGVRAIEHALSFKATPGRRDALILEQAKLDGHTVTVGLEVEPGSGGISQVFAIAARLQRQGYRVVWERPQVQGQRRDVERYLMHRNPTSLTSKAGRADPVSACLERGWRKRGEGTGEGVLQSMAIEDFGKEAGYPLETQTDGIRLFAGSWTQALLDMIEGFPDTETCDEVDAISGAWAWLEAYGYGAAPPPPRTVPDRGLLLDEAHLHPADLEDAQRNRPDPLGRRPGRRRNRPAP